MATVSRSPRIPGHFWFFDPANVEVVVKALDGSGVNQRHWIFYASLSNVEYDAEVLDERTSGVVRRYRNPAGTYASVGDVNAFDSSRGEPSAGRVAL